MKNNIKFWSKFAIVAAIIIILMLIMSNNADAQPRVQDAYAISANMEGYYIAHDVSSNVHVLEAYITYTFSVTNKCSIWTSDDNFFMEINDTNNTSEYEITTNRRTLLSFKYEDRKNNNNMHVINFKCIKTD